MPKSVLRRREAKVHDDEDGDPPKKKKSRSSSSSGQQEQREAECPSAAAHNVVIKTIPISSYEDLNAAEQEIRRLLRSQQQRVPVCMTSDAYHQFRCKAIAAAAGDLGTAGTTLHLSEGLVASIVIQKQEEEQQQPMGSRLCMQLAWEGACYSSSGLLT